MNGPNGSPTFHPVAVSVVIATCWRADVVGRCLEGVARQTEVPEEVLVVYRPEDAATRELLASPRLASLPIRPVQVDTPGLVAARNAALSRVRGDVVAFIDDDAVPRNDWISQIAAAFSSDPLLAGLGGRDLIASQPGPVRNVVGKVQWFGRTIGNHHLGTGQAREVDFLKGCNMSFRIKALGSMRFDPRLRSNGAQVCEDMAFCLALRRAGGNLRYDPALVVDHHPAPAADDHRAISSQNVSDAVHNETLTLLEHLRPIPRSFFVLWSLLIGTRGAPGIAQLPRLVARHRNWPALLLASLRGRALGLIAARSSRRSRRDRAAWATEWSNTSVRRAEVDRTPSRSFRSEGPFP
jgi:GT2 family glycosyltransferase